MAILRFRRAHLLPLLLCMLLGGAMRSAQAANLQTPLLPTDLDPKATTQWVDGMESADVAIPPDRNPGWLVWTQKPNTGHNGVRYGVSKNRGIRHLRIGFTKPIAVGTIITRGEGELSVLRDTAAYPGAIADDAQWLPAQRTRTAEVSVWVLPPGTTTRALRFTVNSTDPLAASHNGYLAGLYLLADRYTNIAPAATPITRARNDAAGLLTDGVYGFWSERWDNGTLAKEPVSETAPEWVMLRWSQPVSLQGICAMWAGIGQADVQAYTGPADRHPREAEEADWRTVTTAKFDHMYPRVFGPNVVDFGETVTTSAIRLRITNPGHENGPHLGNKTMGGKHIWLGELLALQALGTAPLPNSAAAVAGNNLQPPIPITFRLQEPGLVTLAIEDAQGRRVRNLFGETPFTAGDHTVYWDGLDESGRVNERVHGIYQVQGKLVAPGAYRVRGLTHKPIDLHYEFTAYGAGNPAWQTQSQTGGWLADHSPASAVCFVPGETPRILISAHVAEAGYGLITVDLTGRKLGGQRWLGGNWTGASHLARDAGAQAVPGIYAYSGAGWRDDKSGKQGEVRLMMLGDAGNSELLRYTVETEKVPNNRRGYTGPAELRGLAAYNGIVVASVGDTEELLVVNAGTKKLLAAVPLPDARGLAFDAQGRLLALVGKELHRYTLAAAGLSAPEVLVATGLQDPQQLALDAQGNIYISDWGTAHQVKVCSPAGKPLRAIGTAGAPKAGPYDPNRMQHPYGITITSDNRLWVAEQDFLPKRVSVWTLDGKLVTDFIGPAQYGGGGNIDPQDRTRFYYNRQYSGSMELKLDWEKGTAQVSHIIYRPAEGELQLPATGPQTAVYVAGRQYMTNAFNSNPTNGARVVGIWLMRKGLAVPVAAAGTAASWDLLKTDAFRPRWPEGIDLTKLKNPLDVTFAWSDLNGDAQVQPEEVTCTRKQAGSVYVAADLSLVTSYGTRLRPQGFTAAGAPSYDAATAESLVDGLQMAFTSGGGETIIGKDGSVVITGGPMRGYKDGKLLWSYPSQWPGLHAGHSAPASKYLGELVATTRLLGQTVTPRNSDAGELWAINSDRGNAYLLTTDGLFVATLAKDGNTSPGLTFPEAKRGMLFNDISFFGEHFWPSINQTADGQIYLVAGKNHSSIVRLDGLESIRRLPTSTLTVTAEQVVAAQRYFEQSEQQRAQLVGRDTLNVPLAAVAPTLDGKLDEWAGADWALIGEVQQGQNTYRMEAAVRVANGRLYAAFRTGDANLLTNSGEALPMLFKTGGALDIMLGTDPRANEKRTAPAVGDLRLLITRVKGKTVAVRYRPVVPGTKDPQGFSSPWRTVTIDKVEEVSADVQLAAVKGDYEVSIPLEVLGLTPQAGITVRADLGVLRGDGANTNQRLYWQNKATGHTSDVPSEASLTPHLWGRWQFVQE